MTVAKRNGKIEKLSKKKIFNSISNANNSVDENVRLTQKQISDITDSVLNFCTSKGDQVNIDLLEDVIEQKLMESSAYDVAKSYIKYRNVDNLYNSNTTNNSSNNNESNNNSIPQNSTQSNSSENTNFNFNNIDMFNFINNRVKIIRYFRN